MRLNRRIALFKRNEELYLINAVLGNICKISEDEHRLLEKWLGRDEIIADGNEECRFFNELAENGFLNSYNEDETFFTIANQLKDRTNYTLYSPNICFVITYDCNFSCEYCYEDKERLHNKRLTQEMVDRVFMNVSNLEEVGLFGGEPLLPTNRKIIEYIIQKTTPNTRLSVITNGYYLKEFVELLAQRPIRKIQVTIDGSEPYHDSVRILRGGGATYKRIMEGVETALEMDLPVLIRMNVAKDNLINCINERNNLLKKYLGKNIDFELQPIFQIGAHDRDDMISEMFENYALDGGNSIFKKSLPVVNGICNGAPFIPIIRTCDFEGNCRYYDPDGFVYNCILAVGTEEKAIGRFYPMEILREKSFATRDILSINECRNCGLALLCGGGCANGFLDYHSVDRPNCTTFISQIKQMCGFEILIPEGFSNEK